MRSALAWRLVVGLAAPAVATATLAACLGELSFARAEGAYCSQAKPCVAGHFCDLDEQRCLPKVELGQDCSRDVACSSDHCADGVCCSKNCGNQCHACDMTSHLGTCMQVPAGTDPKLDCPGTTACSADAKCQASPWWHIRLGELGRQAAYDVAVSLQDRIAVVGSFRGSIFLNGTHQNPTDHDYSFVALYDNDAGADDAGERKPMWAKVIGGGDQRAEAVTIDANGDVVVAGWYQGSLEIENEGVLTGAGTTNLFVAKFGGDEGALNWLVGDDGPGEQHAFDVITDDAANVYVLGDATDDLDLAGCAVAAQDGVRALALAVLSGASGACGNRALFDGDDGNHSGRSIAIDAVSERLVIGGYGSGPLELPGLAAPFVDGDDDTSYLVQLDRDTLTATWGAPLVGTGYVRLQTMATDPTDGSVWAAGDFTRELIVGDQLLSGGIDDADVFIITLDSGGEPTQGISIGGDFDQHARGIAIDALGKVLVSGHFEVRLGVGAGLESAGGCDAFLANFDTNLKPRWSLPLGGIMNDKLPGLEVDSAGNVIVAGEFQHQIVFGSGEPIESEGDSDVIVAKLRP